MIKKNKNLFFIIVFFNNFIILLYQKTTSIKSGFKLRPYWMPSEQLTGT